MARFQVIPPPLYPRKTAEYPLDRDLRHKMQSFWHCMRGRICQLVEAMFRLARISLREIHSLLGRIEEQLGGTYYVEIGPSCQCSPNEHLVSCKRTLAYTTGIQQLLSNHHWATSVDLAIFLEGWDMGEKFCIEAVRNEDSYNPQ